MDSGNFEILVEGIDWEESFEENVEDKRFVNITENYKENFLLEQRNQNTYRKTRSDIALVELYFKRMKEKRKIEDIPSEELSKLLELFMLSLRKPDSKKYQPGSLASICSSISRHLKAKGRCYDLTATQFEGLKTVIKAKNKVCFFQTYNISTLQFFIVYCIIARLVAQLSSVCY